MFAEMPLDNRTVNNFERSAVTLRPDRAAESISPRTKLLIISSRLAVL